MLVMSIVNRPRPLPNSGRLEAGSAIVVGEGTVESPAIEGLGDLIADAAIVEGVGAVSGGIVGDGVLVAGAAQIVGVGVVPIVGTGELVAGAAQIEGDGPLVGAGAMTAAAAIVSGSDGGGVATSYTNPGGSGNRTGTITVTTTATLGGGSVISNAVDGAFGNNITDSYWMHSAQTSRRITFDFGSPRVIDEAKYYADVSTSQGNWKWQGSNTNNGSDWVDLSTEVSLTGSPTGTVIGDLSANVTAYRYYSMLQSASPPGTSATPWQREWEFKIDAGP